jgi:hypothetical protein
MRHHFVAMQTGPANFRYFEVGQACAAGQLDAFDEAEHVHPYFYSQKNNFSVNKKGITLSMLKAGDKKIVL